MFKKILFYYINNKHTKMPLLVLMIICLGLFELLGIGLFIPLLDKSDNMINDMIGFLLFNIGIERNDLTISLLIFSVFLLKLIVVIIFNKKLTYLVNNFVFEVRNGIVQQLSKVNFIELQKYQIGELNNLVTKESEKISEGYMYVLDIILKVLLTIVYISLSLMTNIYATFFAVLLGFIFVFGFKRIVKLSQFYSKEMLESNEKTNSYINEFLHGLKYLYATNGFLHINNNLKSKLYNYSISKYKLDYYGKLSKEIPEPVGIMIIVTVLIFNYLYMHDSTMSVLMSAVLLYKTFRNIASLQYVYQKLMGVSASVNKINDFSLKIIKEEEENGNLNINKVDKLEFNKLEFKYNDIKVINEMSLEFNKNRTYAFVGNSGSGKTTILNILTLLYKVNQNSYLINDIESSKIDKYSFRLQIGYVSQEPQYFDGSIKDNITLYNNYSDNDIDAIIKKVKLVDVVNEKGLNTSIQSFGKELSGGQLQRINIARELIKQPEILILDEATSALDANIEKEIMSSILELKKETIIIIVAHRLSTLTNVDKILYLDKGKIVDSGNMIKLYNKNENFKLLCNNQNIYLK